MTGKVIKVSENKMLEMQCDLFNGWTRIFALVIDWTTKCDHAGITIEFDFLRILYINISLVDNRHWDV